MINSVHAGAVGGAHQSTIATQVSRRSEANVPGEQVSEFAKFLADVLTKIDASGVKAHEAGSRKPDTDRPVSRGASSGSDVRVPVR